MHGRGRHSAVHLAQRADVIQDVKRTAMRGNNEIVLFNDEIRNLCIRQIQRQRLPNRAIVKRHIDSVLGSGI